MGLYQDHIGLKPESLHLSEVFRGGPEIKPLSGRRSPFVHLFTWLNLDFRRSRRILHNVGFRTVIRGGGFNK